MLDLHTLSRLTLLYEPMRRDEIPSELDAARGINVNISSGLGLRLKCKHDQSQACGGVACWLLHFDLLIHPRLTSTVLHLLGSSCHPHPRRTRCLRSSFQAGANTSIRLLEAVQVKSPVAATARLAGLTDGSAAVQEVEEEWKGAGNRGPRRQCLS